MVANDVAAGLAFRGVRPGRLTPVDHVVFFGTLLGGGGAGPGQVIAPAALRGSANPIMHYTTMAVVIFFLSKETLDVSHAVSIESLGVLGISIVPVMVLVVALMTSLLDRLHKQRSLLDGLFTQAPLAIALMRADDRVVHVNREFSRLCRPQAPAAPTAYNTGWRVQSDNQGPRSQSLRASAGESA
jgi:hypothetical protein